MYAALGIPFPVHINDAASDVLGSAGDLLNF